MLCNTENVNILLRTLQKPLSDDTDILINHMAKSSTQLRW